MIRFLRLFLAYRRLEERLEILLHGRQNCEAELLRVSNEAHGLRGELTECDAARDQLRQDLVHVKAAFREAEDRNLRMQDHLVSMQSQHQQLLQMVDSAHRDEVRTYQMLVNFETQSKYGVAPFPDAVKIPITHMASTDQAAAQADYVRGSTLVARAHDKFRADLQALISPDDDEQTYRD